MKRKKMVAGQRARLSDNGIQQTRDNKSPLYQTLSLPARFVGQAETVMGYHSNDDDEVYTEIGLRVSTLSSRWATASI